MILKCPFIIIHAHAMDNIMFNCLSSSNSAVAAFHVDGLTRQKKSYCSIFIQYTVCLHDFVKALTQNRKYNFCTSGRNSTLLRPWV